MIFYELRDSAAPRITNEPPEVVTAVMGINQSRLEKRGRRMMGVEGIQVEEARFAALDSDVLAVVRLKLVREELR